MDKTIGNGKNWLVTGSSGYIGKHLVQLLLSFGYPIIGLDLLQTTLSASNSDKFKFYHGDFTDEILIQKIFSENQIEGIFHLAAVKSVEESMLNPELYDRINRLGAIKLLDTAIANGSDYYILSSTAAVYGYSESGILSEDSPIQPGSPYGASKYAAELALQKQVMLGKIKGVSLRYFNVLGAIEEKFRDSSTSNIVPKVLEAIRQGTPPLIFGDDYETEDGTAIRDYVHVCDVARAHYLTLEKLKLNDLPLALNIGTGNGYSVKQVVSEIISQSQSLITPRITNRRIGDVPKVIANVNLAKNVLGFESEFDLPEMIKSSL